MRRRFSPSREVLVIASLLVTAGQSAAKPVQCPPGRYVITRGAAIVVGDSAPDPGTVVVQGRQIGLGTHCALRNGSVRATKKGTRIKGQWPSCGELRGVRIAGLIQTDCQAMTGTVKAKKAKAQTFEARLSTCGDQLVDPGAGEACDSGIGCAAGKACTADCRCVPLPTTTTQPTSTTISATTSTTGVTIESTTTTVFTATTTSTTQAGVQCPQTAIVKATLTLVPATDGSTVSPFAGIKVNLAYPAGVSLPGMGALPVGDPANPATREVLLDAPLYAGLVVFNDTDAALVTTLALTTPEPLAGPLAFEQARFDCAPSAPIDVAGFSCAVVDEADQLGAVIPPSQRPACEVVVSP